MASEADTADDGSLKPTDSVTNDDASDNNGTTTARGESESNADDATSDGDNDSTVAKSEAGGPRSSTEDNDTNDGDAVGGTEGDGDNNDDDDAGSTAEGSVSASANVNDGASVGEPSDAGDVTKVDPESAVAPDVGVEVGPDDTSVDPDSKVVANPDSSGDNGSPTEGSGDDDVGNADGIASAESDAAGGAVAANAIDNENVPDADDDASINDKKSSDNDNGKEPGNEGTADLSSRSGDEGAGRSAGEDSTSPDDADNRGKDPIPEPTVAPGPDSKDVVPGVVTDNDAPPEAATENDAPPEAATENDAPPEAATENDAPPEAATENDAPPEAATENDAPPEAVTEIVAPEAAVEADAAPDTAKGADAIPETSIENDLSPVLDVPKTSENEADAVPNSGRSVKDPGVDLPAPSEAGTTQDGQGETDVPAKQSPRTARSETKPSSRSKDASEASARGTPRSQPPEKGSEVDGPDAQPSDPASPEESPGQQPEVSSHASDAVPAIGGMEDLVSASEAATPPAALNANLSPLGDVPPQASHGVASASARTIGDSAVDARGALSSGMPSGAVSGFAPPAHSQAQLLHPPSVGQSGGRIHSHQPRGPMTADSRTGGGAGTGGDDIVQVDSRPPPRAGAGRMARERQHPSLTVDAATGRESAYSPQPPRSASPMYLSQATHSPQPRLASADTGLTPSRAEVATAAVAAAEAAALAAEHEAAVAHGLGTPGHALSHDALGPEPSFGDRDSFEVPRAVGGGEHVRRGVAGPDFGFSGDDAVPFDFYEPPPRRHPGAGTLAPGASGSQPDQAASHVRSVSQAGAYSNAIAQNGEVGDAPVRQLGHVNAAAVHPPRTLGETELEAPRGVDERVVGDEPPTSEGKRIGVKAVRIPRIPSRPTSARNIGMKNTGTTMTPKKVKNALGEWTIERLHENKVDVGVSPIPSARQDGGRVPGPEADIVRRFVTEALQQDPWHGGDAERRPDGGLHEAAVHNPRTHAHSPASPGVAASPGSHPSTGQAHNSTRAHWQDAYGRGSRVGPHMAAVSDLEAEIDAFLKQVGETGVLHPLQGQHDAHGAAAVDPRRRPPQGWDLQRTVDDSIAALSPTGVRPSKIPHHPHSHPNSYPTAEEDAAEFVLQKGPRPPPHARHPPHPHQSPHTRHSSHSSDDAPRSAAGGVHSDAQPAQPGVQPHHVGSMPAQAGRGHAQPQSTHHTHTHDASGTNTHSHSHAHPQAGRRPSSQADSRDGGHSAGSDDPGRNRPGVPSHARNGVGVQPSVVVRDPPGGVISGGVARAVRAPVVGPPKIHTRAPPARFVLHTQAQGQGRPEDDPVPRGGGRERDGDSSYSGIRGRMSGDGRSRSPSPSRNEAGGRRERGVAGDDSDRGSEYSGGSPSKRRDSSRQERDASPGGRIRVAAKFEDLLAADFGGPSMPQRRGADDPRGDRDRAKEWASVGDRGGVDRHRAAGARVVSDIGRRADEIHQRQRDDDAHRLAKYSGGSDGGASYHRETNGYGKGGGFQPQGIKLTSGTRSAGSSPRSNRRRMAGGAGAGAGAGGGRVHRIGSGGAVRDRDHGRNREPASFSQNPATGSKLERLVAGRDDVLQADMDDLKSDLAQLDKRLRDNASKREYSVGGRLGAPRPSQGMPSQAWKEDYGGPTSGESHPVPSHASYSHQTGSHPQHQQYQNTAQGHGHPMGAYGGDERGHHYDAMVPNGGAHQQARYPPSYHPRPPPHNVPSQHMQQPAYHQIQHQQHPPALPVGQYYPQVPPSHGQQANSYSLPHPPEIRADPRVVVGPPAHHYHR